MVYVKMSDGRPNGNAAGFCRRSKLGDSSDGPNHLYTACREILDQARRYSAEEQRYFAVALGNLAKAMEYGTDKREGNAGGFFEVGPPSFPPGFEKWPEKILFSPRAKMGWKIIVHKDKAQSHASVGERPDDDLPGVRHFSFAAARSLIADAVTQKRLEDATRRYVGGQLESNNRK